MNGVCGPACEMNHEHYGQPEISDPVDGVPRWLELQAEIDYRLFLLGEIKRHFMTATSPMDVLVDEAVYRPKAEQLMAEVDELKAEFFAEIGDDSPVVSSVVLPQPTESPGIKGDSWHNGVSGAADRGNDQPPLTTHLSEQRGQL